MIYKLLLIFVNKLNLIRNYDGNNLDNFDASLNIIKDFIKENNNLSFLAYKFEDIFASNLSDRHHESYKSLENLVKNTQPFVKMVKYDDLVVKVSDIDGNLLIN